MRLFKRNTKKKTFEITFATLKGLGESNPAVAKTYALLQKLNDNTSEEESEKLLRAVKKIRFASNTYTVFHFYFPIVAHILFFKPGYEKELLGYLVGPNFANGESEARDLIPLLQRAMNYKLNENKHAFTKEGKAWVLKELPRMEDQIAREVQLCHKELDE